MPFPSALIQSEHKQPQLKFEWIDNSISYYHVLQYRESWIHAFIMSISRKRTHAYLYSKLKKVSSIRIVYLKAHNKSN